MIINLSNVQGGEKTVLVSLMRTDSKIVKLFILKPNFPPLWKKQKFLSWCTKKQNKTNKKPQENRSFSKIIFSSSLTSSPPSKYVLSIPVFFFNAELSVYQQPVTSRPLKQKTVFIELAKKFVWVFLSHCMLKRKWTFWPSQYIWRNWKTKYQHYSNE